MTELHKHAPAWQSVPNSVFDGTDSALIALRRALHAYGDFQKPRNFSGFVIRWRGSTLGGGDAGQAGFFDVGERLKQLSAKGDSLERLGAVVDFERFRADLERAVVRSDRLRVSVVRVIGTRGWVN